MYFDQKEQQVTLQVNAEKLIFVNHQENIDTDDILSFSEEEQNNTIKEETIFELLNFWNNNLSIRLKYDRIQFLFKTAWQNIVYSPQVANNILNSIDSYSAEIKNIIFPLCLIGCGRDEDVEVDHLYNFYLTIDNIIGLIGKEQSYEVMLFSSRMIKHLIFNKNPLLSEKKIEQSIINIMNNYGDFFFDLFAVDIYLRMKFCSLQMNSEAIKNNIKIKFDAFLNKKHSVIANIYPIMLNPFTCNSSPVRKNIEEMCNIAILASNFIEMKWIIQTTKRILSVYPSIDDESEKDKYLKIVFDSFKHGAIDNSTYFQYIYLKNLIETFEKTKEIGILIEFEKRFLSKKNILFANQIMYLQLEYASCLYIFFSLCKVEQADSSRFIKKIRENSTQQLINDPLFSNQLFSFRMDCKIKADDKGYINKGYLLGWLSEYTEKIFSKYIEKTIRNNHLFVKHFTCSVKIFPLRGKYSSMILESIKYNIENKKTDSLFCMRTIPLFPLINPSKHIEISIDYLRKIFSNRYSKYELYSNRYYLSWILYNCYFYGDSSYHEEILKFTEILKIETESYSSTSELYFVLVTILRQSSITDKDNFIDKLSLSMKEANRKIFSLKNEKFDLVFPDGFFSVIDDFSKNGNILSLAAKVEIRNPEYWNILATTSFNKAKNVDSRLLQTAAIFYSIAKCFARERKSFDQKYCYNFIRCQSAYYSLLKKRPSDYFFRDVINYIASSSARSFYHREESCRTFFILLDNYWDDIQDSEKRLMTVSAKKDDFIKNVLLSKSYRKNF